MPVLVRRLVALVLAATLISCAAKLPARPSGTAAPDASATTLFTEVTRQCRGLRTVTTVIALSGRAGSERLRGRLHAGFAAPQAIRLEGIAPFGPPAFVLAGQQDRATLFFPRENRVLPDTPVADVLERLTGLDLGADDLRLVLSGCLVAEAPTSGGQSWTNGWKSVPLAPDRVAYLRQASAMWVVAGADYGAWRIDYADHLNGWPRTVRVRSSQGGVVDLTARLDELEINVDLPSSAFVVDVLPDATPISLDDLRSVAPLRGGS
ncbi:MAG: hypothetical protein ABR606_00475 [Vicinamibacterales bacterium]